MGKRAQASTHRGYKGNANQIWLMKVQGFYEI